MASKAKEIAHDLNLSEQTVNFYLSRARAKLRVANTTEAAVRAAELGLLRPDPADAA
jgi:DNA-binding NarL/FixJ family response regulator